MKAEFKNACDPARGDREVGNGKTTGPYIF